MSSFEILCFEEYQNDLTLLHSERPKLYRVLAILSAIGLTSGFHIEQKFLDMCRVEEHGYTCKAIHYNATLDIKYHFMTFNKSKNSTYLLNKGEKR